MQRSAEELLILGGGGGWDGRSDENNNGVARNPKFYSRLLDISVAEKLFRPNRPETASEASPQVFREADPGVPDNPDLWIFWDRRAGWGLFCIPDFAQYHTKPQTPNPKHHTPNPKPANPKTKTKTLTRNPIPQTLNHKTETQAWEVGMFTSLRSQSGEMGSPSLRRELFFVVGLRVEGLGFGLGVSGV